MHDARSRVASIDRDIAANRRDIADRNTSDLRRDMLRRQLRTLEDDRRRALGAQTDAQAALDKLRQEHGA